MRIDSSEPTIRNCTIEGNVGSNGGGIKVTNTTVFTLDSCTVKNNSSTGGNRRYGGGIFISSVDTILTNCTILDNSISSKDSYGGGVYVGGTLTMSNCKIINNSANAYECCCGCTVTSYGGGVYVSGAAAMYNSIICSNSVSTKLGPCSGGYGDVYSRGGGVFLNSASGIINCTICNNTTATYTQQGSRYRQGGGIYFSGTATFDVINSIIWENTPNQIIGNVAVTYSDVQGGYGNPEDNNINFNPVWGTCLQILPGSMCIDAGNPDPLYNDVCMPPSLGTERNDMGAHGGPGACAWIYCDGDFDCDTDIDGSDLSIFAADFGRTDCSGDCEGDFDNDDDVDGSDLAMFAANFGATDCCPR